MSRLHITSQPMRPRHQPGAYRPSPERRKFIHGPIQSDIKSPSRGGTFGILVGVFLIAWMAAHFIAWSAQ